ncbi:MAG: hypothetical protein ACYSR4_01930, partial [Planctomycetota bacterium]
MDSLEREFYEYRLTHDQPYFGTAMYAPQGNALRNVHQERARLRVLLFPLEFSTWKRASHWTYAAQLGLEEGFAANDVEFFTIPVIQEVPS